MKAGAGVIWGHHPHVLQRLEWLERGEDKPALVAYSLGNTLFDQLYPQTARGAILLVTADRQGVQSVRVLPVAIDPLHGRVNPADSVEGAQVSRQLRNQALSTRLARGLSWYLVPNYQLSQRLGVISTTTLYCASWLISQSYLCWKRATSPAG